MQAPVTESPTMLPFTRQDLLKLAAPQVAPCITVTMAIRHEAGELSRNATGLRDLARRADEKLRSRPGGSPPDMARVVEDIATLRGVVPLSNGSAFWSELPAGLAVFASPRHFSWHVVPLSLPSEVTVGESFHVRPLLPMLMREQRFHLLAITRNEVALYQGDAAGLSRLPLVGVPRSFAEVVSAENHDQRADLASHGSGPMGGHALHGYGKGSDDENAELRKYFRAIDRAIAERYSRPSGLPLVLCAVGYYLPLYHEVSHDPHLQPQGIPHDPVGMSHERLHADAWKLFEEVRRARLDTALDHFEVARARGHAATALDEVGRAAAGGRVGTLLLEENRERQGTFDARTGAIRVGPGESVDGQVDVLEEMAELVLRKGGDVLVVPPSRMPGDAGAVATLRY